MPIYEYVCENCHTELEALQKISDPQLTECPDCGQSTLKRKTSISAFHLKGGGWYKDGYSVPDGSSDKTNGSSDTSTDTSTSNDAKPAPTPEKTAATSDTKESPSTNVPSSKAS